MVWNALFGEKATTKLAGFFDSEQELEGVSAKIRSASGLQNTQLWVVRPHDSDYHHKLEPETQGVARTAIRSHLWLGLVGMLAGVLLWLVLYFAGIAAIVSSPFYSGAAIVAFATVAGLLLGGLVTSRPDHQVVVQRVDEATKAGRWTLILHPRSEEQCKAVEDVLNAAKVETVRTI